jgi:hypothetical protein
MAVDTSPDLLPLDELAGRLHLSTKTVKQLHRDKGLPLFRFNDGGPYFGFWSQVEAWAKARHVNGAAP